MLAVVLATLVAAEIGARALAPALPEPLLWRDALTQAKVEQMDALAAQGGVDAVFAGTSQMLFGLDPATFSRQTGVSAYNAGIYGATPELTERWLLDVVVPRLDPKVVVWGVAGPDLVDGSPRWNSAFSSYRGAIATRPGALASAERWLIDRSAVVRHRRQLRDVGEVAAAATRRVRGDAAPVDAAVANLTPLGHSVTLHQRGYAPPRADRHLFRNDVLADFAIGRRQLRALRRVVAALQSDGIAVVLVEMPMAAELVEMYPRGALDARAVHEVINREAAAFGAPVLDLRTGFDRRAYFADLDHLNGPGASVLTSVLAQLFRGGSLEVAVARLPQLAARPLIDPTLLTTVPGIGAGTVAAAPPAADGSVPPVTPPVTVPPVAEPPPAASPPTSVPPVTTPPVTTPPTTIPTLPLDPP